MAGAKTHSYGYVVEIGTIPHPYYGNLPYQWKATYSCIKGDSGAPIYQQDTTTHEFCLVGLQWGKIETENVSLFSPLSGIMTDLGIVPKTR